MAQTKAGVPTRLVEARLDNWNGQENWVVTLVEKEVPRAWHIFVLNAQDGFVRQHLRLAY